jgi:hypothetical protein
MFLNKLGDSIMGVCPWVFLECVIEFSFGKVSHDAHFLRGEISLQPNVSFLREEVTSKMNESG